MTSFSDQFPNADMLDVLGDDITYKRGSKKYLLKATITDVGANIYINELHTEATLLRTALPLTPQRSDLIIAGSRTYTVDRDISNDPNLYTLVIR